MYSLSMKYDKKVKIVLLTILIFILFALACKNIKTQEDKPITEETVWTYWHSSYQPKIVKRCIKNWKTVGSCTDVRVLNRNTVLKWIPEETMAEFSSITNNEANKSDLIRLYLLHRYGGIWMDASVFANRKLSSWVPKGDTVFCFKADRFSKKNVTCLENFFIKAKPGDKLIKDWLNMCINDFSDENYKTKNKEFRNIIGKNGDYLVPYVSSMKLVLNNYENLVTESAEKGPYKDTIQNGWDPIKICQNITYTENLVKLYNQTRKQCSPDIVPVTAPSEDYLPNNVYNRFKNRFKMIKHENHNLDVDMVYCISMPQRKKYITQMLEQLQTPYKMFDAIKPSDLSVQDYTRLSQTYSPTNLHLYRQWTKLPVALSFFMCYYDAYLNGYETVMFLEDDIKYMVSLDKIYAAVKDFKSTDCEVLFLGYCWANCGMTYPNITEHLYRAPIDTQMLCNHALVMKESFLKRFMERDEVTFWRHRNDHTLSDYIQYNKINKCVTSPAYISQNRSELGSNNKNSTKDPTTCNLHKRI